MNPCHQDAVSSNKTFESSRLCRFVLTLPVHNSKMRKEKQLTAQSTLLLKWKVTCPRNAAVMATMTSWCCYDATVAAVDATTSAATAEYIAQTESAEGTRVAEYRHTALFHRKM